MAGTAHDSLPIIQNKGMPGNMIRCRYSFFQKKVIVAKSSIFRQGKRKSLPAIEPVKKLM
jgi:hypothetical protein